MRLLLIPPHDSRPIPLTDQDPIWEAPGPQAPPISGKKNPAVQGGVKATRGAVMR